ncbi:MAG: ROK family protein [Cyclobacteriaceae bacterium]
MEILGVDIGGSGIKGAIVDTAKGILLTDRHRIATPQPATPSAVVETVDEIIDFFNWKGIVGCGFPAAIVNDVVMTASNIDKSWLGVNAATEIIKNTGCPTHLINDVDAAGVAEIKYGAGKGIKGSVMMVAAGTGIGTALFYDGRLFPNTELGHIRMEDGKIGEHYAANSVRKKKELTWEEWAKRMNKYLKMVDFLFWPELIILGGGVSKYHHEFFEYFDVRPPVVPAEMRNKAGIIGAAYYAEYKECKK